MPEPSVFCRRHETIERYKVASCLLQDEKFVIRKQMSALCGQQWFISMFLKKIKLFYFLYVLKIRTYVFTGQMANKLFQCLNVTTQIMLLQHFCQIY